MMYTCHRAQDRETDDVGADTSGTTSILRVLDIKKTLCKCSLPPKKKTPTSNPPPKKKCPLPANQFIKPLRKKVKEKKNLDKVTNRKKKNIE